MQISVLERHICNVSIAQHRLVSLVYTFVLKHRHYNMQFILHTLFIIVKCLFCCQTIRFDQYLVIIRSVNPT
jgi:hypothetical protein